MIRRLDRHTSSVVIYSPARRAKRFQQFGLYEYLWLLEYAPRDVSNGIALGPSLRISFNLEWRRPDQLIGLNDRVLTIASALSKAQEFRYGFYDVADVRESALGRLYSGAFPLNLPNFQRRVQRVVWEMEGDGRVEKARGVFWGNLFSENMIARLGGETWLDQYHEFENPRGDKLHFRLSNGVYLVMICGDARELRDRSLHCLIQTMRRAAMLHKRLCSTGLMCGVSRPEH